jgi:hypothetical protein
VQKLMELFPVHATLKFPVSEPAMQAALEDSPPSAA